MLVGDMMDSQAHHCIVQVCCTDSKQRLPHFISAALLQFSTWTRTDTKSEVDPQLYLVIFQILRMSLSEMVSSAASRSRTWSECSEDTVQVGWCSGVRSVVIIVCRPVVWRRRAWRTMLTGSSPTRRYGVQSPRTTASVVPG